MNHLKISCLLVKLLPILQITYHSLYSIHFKLKIQRHVT